MAQQTDDRYRNTTRFFTTAARPSPSLSRDHVGDDTGASRDRDGPGATFDDVMPASRNTFRLVLIGLDVVILLYRVAHVCRAVNRMRNCWSRDHRKYYNDDDDDDDYWSSVTTRDRTRHSTSPTGRRSGSDEVDDAVYQLSSTSSSFCRQSTLACRLVRSSYLAKLVMFVALVTSCRIALQVIDSSRLPGHINLVNLAADSLLPQLDSDIQTVYRAQREYSTGCFDGFVVNSLSHLSVMIQLVANGKSSVIPLKDHDAPWTSLCIHPS